MSTETETWFLTEVLRWREFAASSWSVILNTGLVWALVTTLSTVEHIGDPKLVITNSFSSIFSPSSWPYLITGTICVVQLCKLYAASGKAVPTVAKSVISCVNSAITADLASVLQFTVFGGVLSVVLIRLTGSPLADVFVTTTNSVVDKDAGVEDGRSLNPSLVCIFLAGCFAGLQGAWDCHYRNGSYLEIQMINLDKYSLVKQKLQAEVWPLVIRSFVMLLRFVIGFSAVTWLLGYMTLHDVYNDVMRLSLVCASFAGILYVLSVLACVRVCSGAHLVAPLQQLCLENLLDGAASSSSILSLLSLQSLSDMTLECADVRREIFSLSIPGGHPHTWNRLLAVTLKNLQNMNSDLTKLFAPPKEEEKEEKPFPSVNTSFARSIASPNMRSLAPPPSSDKQQSSAAPAAPEPPKWVQKLTDNWNTFVAGLSRRPAVAWLVNQPPDLKSREILTRCQAAIYSAEALSHVVRASITEDSYGVVQKDLPDILTSLLRLEELIDRCRGQGSFHRKRSADPADVQLKLELKCAVKSAVYRIVIAFREHILVVPLEVDLAKKIRNCHNFLEA